jgi:tetratricopeptide (TPR) repeat protein
VDVKRGGSWQELYIGDSITGSDTLRLEQDAIVELRGKSEQLTFVKEGTYRVGDMVQTPKKHQQRGFGSMLAGKMSSMFSGAKHQSPGSVGGVRGAEAGEKQGLSWVESDTQELITAGKQHLENGEYQQALSQFQEAYDYAFDRQEEQDASFYIGYTYTAMGEKGRAVKQLKAIDPQPEADYYYNYYFLLSKLLLDGFAFQEATELLLSFDATYASSDEKQVIDFLTGIAFWEAENNEKASEYLTRAVEADPESEMGRSAAELLASISPE